MYQEQLHRNEHNMTLHFVYVGGRRDCYGW